MKLRFIAMSACSVLALAALAPQTVAAAAPQGDSVVVPYPKLLTDVDDPSYSVTVNGVPVYVHGLHWHYTDGDTTDFPMNDNGWAYAHFAFGGTAHVVVTYKDSVHSYTLSPQRYGIPSQATGRQISFDLTEPLKLELHNVNSADSNVIGSNDEQGTHFGKNDDPDNLLIWADPLEVKPPSPDDPDVIDAKKSGADSTGASDASEALNRAIQKLHKGGTLYLDPGSYLIRHSINLKSDMRLYLAPGSEVVQAQQYYQTDPATGVATPQLSGADNMLNILNADNVTIDGRGRLNAQGQYNRWHNFQWWTTMMLHNANNITVRDIVSFNAAGGDVWQEDGTNVRFYNYKVDTNNGAAESDMVNFLNCLHCGVDNSFGKTTDDPVNFASGPSQSGANSNFDGSPDPVNDPRYAMGDLSITNNVVINNGTGAGFAAGTAGVTDIVGALWENNTIISSPQVWRALAGGGGAYRNYRINNLVSEAVTSDMNNFNPYITGSTSNPSLGTPIGLKTKIPYWNYDAWKAAGGRVGSINGVSFSNVQINVATDCSHIAPNELVSHSNYHGAGETVSNVTFNDVTFAGHLLTGIDHPANNHSPYLYQGQCKPHPTYPDPNVMNAANPGAGWKTIDWADGGNVDENGNLPSLLDQPKVHGQHPVNPAYNPSRVPDWTDWSTIHFTSQAVQLVNVRSEGKRLTLTRSSSHGPLDVSAPLTVNYRVVTTGRSGDEDAAAGTESITIPAGTAAVTIGRGQIERGGVGACCPSLLLELTPGYGYQMDGHFLATMASEAAGPATPARL